MEPNGDRLEQLRDQVRSIEIRQRAAIGFLRGALVGLGLLLAVLQWYAVGQISTIRTNYERITRLEQRIEALERGHEELQEDQQQERAKRQR